MNFAQLQVEVGEWSRRNFPGNEPVYPLLGVVEELGELSHAVLKAKQGIRGTPEEHRAAVIDAVGDLTIYMADFCGRNGVTVPREPSVLYLQAGTTEAKLLSLSYAVGVLAEGYGFNETTQHTWATMRVLDAVAGFCRVADVDFDAAVAATWAEARKRDWVMFPKDGRTK